MQIIFTPEAISDLQEIKLHIQQDNIIAATKATKTIIERIAQLESFPNLGISIENSKTKRKLLIANLPYYTFYKIENSNIKILRIYHTARQNI